MPSYSFKNTETGEEWEELLTISEREKFLEQNPHIQQLPSLITISGGVGGIKNDGGWGDNMSRIAEAHPGSELAASMGSQQSTKEVKTRKAVEKWRKSRAAKGD